jgi:hypothetical protein
MNEFIYTIEQRGAYLIIKDARSMEVVNSYNKINPNFDIKEDLARIVFAVPSIKYAILDFKALKHGYIKIKNNLTQEQFTIKFMDKDGNNIFGKVVKEIFGEPAESIDQLVNFFSNTIYEDKN